MELYSLLFLTLLLLPLQDIWKEKCINATLKAIFPWIFYLYANENLNFILCLFVWGVKIRDEQKCSFFFF